MTERRTRLVVDIVWNGDDTGWAGDEHYYEDSELVDTASRWITDAFYDRDDSPRVTVTEAPSATDD